MTTQPLTAIEYLKEDLQALSERLAAGERVGPSVVEELRDGLSYLVRKLEEQDLVES